MKQIKHPNIVALLGVCTQQLPFYIITEFMINGNMANYLRGPEGKDIETTTLIYMAQQVCSAMSYLASKNIIHRYASLCHLEQEPRRFIYVKRATISNLIF